MSSPDEYPVYTETFSYVSANNKLDSSYDRLGSITSTKKCMFEIMSMV